MQRMCAQTGGASRGKQDFEVQLPVPDITW